MRAFSIFKKKTQFTERMKLNWNFRSWGELKPKKNRVVGRILSEYLMFYYWISTLAEKILIQLHKKKNSAKDNW